MIDTGADALYNPKCSLTWLMTDEQAKSKDKLFGFEGKKIYRIKARESFAKGKNYLMVCGVTERNCTDDRLVHILEEYEKPVEISVSGCDKLVLNKELDLFEGNCSANGSEFMLMLNVDDDNEDYSLSRQLWENLYANFCEWVDNARKFAAEMLIDTADDWLFSAYSD